MGWEKGRYYTRSRKVNGRVVREYIGGGEQGALVAKLDEMARDRRELARFEWKMAKEEMETFDETVGIVCQMADIMAKAELIAAGYHLHRGEWRRRRVTDDKA